MKTIVIIDYGMGNLKSVEKALELAISNINLKGKLSVEITCNTFSIKMSDGIVLPGVGAFGEAMLNLEKLCLVERIRYFVGIEKKPFLGICLGYQLLFDKSYEEGEFSGFGMLKGEVKKFDDKLGLKIPHMGWNTVDFGDNSNLFKNTISNMNYYYFVHSYYVDIAKNFNGNVFWSEYGIKFAAGIEFDNILGLQFHPEKSQQNGIKILENWCKKVYET